MNSLKTLELWLKMHRFTAPKVALAMAVGILCALLCWWELPFTPDGLSPQNRLKVVGMTILPALGAGWSIFLQPTSPWLYFRVHKSFWKSKLSWSLFLSCSLSIVLLISSIWLPANLDPVKDFLAVGMLSFSLAYLLSFVMPLKLALLTPLIMAITLSLNLLEPLNLLFNPALQSLKLGLAILSNAILSLVFTFGKPRLRLTEF